MRVRGRAMLAMILGLTAGAVRGADHPAVAFRGARILTATGAIHEPGVLVVEERKIAAVGAERDVEIPDGAEVRDVSGKTIIPGLVDSHSHLGVYSRPAVPANSDGNEMSGPLQGLVRALDALNPYDPGIRMANAGGVTAANIMPGSGNVIGGQTVYVKLRGYTPEQMWIDSPDVLGGLKMANGENPKRAYGGRKEAPGSRMKVAALQRSELLRARDYERKWDAYRKKLAAGDEEAAPPDVDLSLEPLVEVLQRKRTVHFHSHRADDILTALRLKKEFGFELVIQHGTESYKVREEIAQADVPVSMTLLDSPGGKAEVVDFVEQCGAELTEAGIKVLINTDDPITESRFLLRTAAIAVRGGMSEEDALKAVTLYPAQVMHLDHRIGSLEPGKDADFVILSGAPFSVYTRVLQTYIDGEKVFDLGDERQRLYQTGGFAVADSTRVPAPEPIDAEPTPEAPAAPAGRPAPTTNSTEIVVFAGRLHTVANGTIENGVVHVREGKIVFAGPRAGFEVPENVPVLTAAAVTPGLIDAHSVVPLDGEFNIAADQDADELSDPNQADLRVLDGFNPSEPLLRFLLQQGVTVVHACPGRENVIAGTTGVFRTHGRTAESMTIRFPQAVLFNLGEVPKEAYERKRPGTRMGTAALIRQALTDAANDARKREQAQEEGDAPPDRNLRHEALAPLLERKLPALFCAQRADDILTALRLAKEFDLDAQLALAAEGYLVADQLAVAEIPVIAHPTMQRIGEIESFNSVLGNAAAMSDRGITVAVGSGVEGYVPKTRVVRHEAAMAAVHGLGFERALRAVTLDAAKILKIDDRYGSLEAGKVADLVLYDGDPFEHATHTTHVLLDGRIVFDRAQQPALPVGRAFYLSAPEIPCCLGW